MTLVGETVFYPPHHITGAPQGQGHTVRDEPQTQDPSAAYPDKAPAIACTAPGPLPQAGPRGHGSHRHCGPLNQDTGTTSPWLPQPLPHRDKSILLSLSCRSLWALGSSLSSPEPSTVVPSPKLRDTADSFRISPHPSWQHQVQLQAPGQAGCGSRCNALQTDVT